MADDKTDIAKVAMIAEGLTSGEWNGLLRTREGANYEYRDMHGIPRIGLFRLGLIRKAEGPSDYRYELTDLGIAVRKHMREG